MPAEITKCAELDPTKTYRWYLGREWNKWGHRILFIMLNPSTADDQIDDATIRKCIGFAQRWGFGGITVANLFAYRATDPKELKKAADPVGKANDDWLLSLSGGLSEGKTIVAAWGVHGAFKDRDQKVAGLLKDKKLFCLGTTKDGHPKHPLYIPYGTELKLWMVPEQNGSKRNIIV